MVLVLTGDFFRQAPARQALPADAANTADIGRCSIPSSAHPFEIAAMVLLVAMVAAVSLTLRKRKDARYLDPAEQVKVKVADRLRVISMPAEKEESGGDMMPTLSHFLVFGAIPFAISVVGIFSTART